MRLFIDAKFASGKRFELEILPTDTVLSLKRRIREITRIPLKRMRFRNYDMTNDRLLSDYNITDQRILEPYCLMGGGAYCSGCYLPKFFALSANVSLTCVHDFAFDNAKLLHSIKTQLRSLGNDSEQTLIDCITTCGEVWDSEEADDAAFFKDQLERRRSQATNKFIGTICKMVDSYSKKYRAWKEASPPSNSTTNADASTSELDNPIEVDWLCFLHEIRCPICFDRFTTVQTPANNKNRMPMSLCSVSDKHVVCKDCCQGLVLCLLCNGQRNTNVTMSQKTIDSINNAWKKLEEFCFPTNLANRVQIAPTQQSIACGAMGRVFRVSDIYAVKCALIQSTPEMEQALIHEIAISRPLAHIPNLVRVYGGVRLPHFGIGIVMEYIDGPSLASALDDQSMVIRNLPIRKRLKIALGICQGLKELHLAKIVHRDFKPENILLSRSPDGTYVPKIGDFGVSFQIATASATMVKEAGGTVGYDAPEVAIDGLLPSVRSDIYALAFILYELLTAKRAFSGLKPSQILSKFTMKGERPTDWPNGISDALKDAIKQAWSIEPNERRNLTELISAVEKSLGGDQPSCLKMLVEVNKSRKKVTTSIKLGDFKSFELYAIDEFVKRIAINDCEAMKMFIENLPPGL